MRKPLPNALDIDFKGGLSREVTPHAGIALMIETGRRSGVMAAAEQYPPPKRSPQGLGQGQFVVAFVLLSAMGGDCLDDRDGLRRDLGLAALTGCTLPAAKAARQWLDRLHDETLLSGRPAQGSFIPRESDGLAAVRAVLQFSVRTSVSAVAPGPAVTLPVDAHLVESSKQQALPTYAGFRGYQPLLVSWAETGLVLTDAFRDGNVPASVGIKDLVDEADASLPGQVAVRSDSAAYAHAILDHWHARGWRLAVSAAMSPARNQPVTALPETAWQGWRQAASGTVRAWAAVASVPDRPTEQRDAQPYRYVAIRVRKAQGELFADENTSKHFAVVTHDWATDGQALLEWQRGKAGTIEHVNRTLKDELGAGVYPSGKFGANAAWLRLPCLTLNLLECLQAVGLDPQYRKARPKRLRLAIFTQFGRVVRHARQLGMRLGTDLLDRVVWPVRSRVARAGWGAP